MLAILVAPWAATASAEWSPPTPPIVVSAGYWVPLNIPFNVLAGICDDTTVVRTEMGNGVLGVTGLKPGRTLCGYWGTRPRYLLFTVTVVP